jgi:hypothetical protein
MRPSSSSSFYAIGTEDWFGIGDRRDSGDMNDARQQGSDSAEPL